MYAIIKVKLTAGEVQLTTVKLIFYLLRNNSTVMQLQLKIYH